jgi:phospholipase/carboxylesterase
MLTTGLFAHKYVPAKVPGPREKVMVVLHGLGDSLNGFTWLPSALRIDSLSYLLVNAPDDYYGGFSWFDFTGGGADMGPAIAGIKRSRGLIQGLLDELRKQGVAAADIFLFGFSQGCLMALDAGLRYGDRLGGIVGVSGWLAFQEEYPAAFSPVAKEQDFLVTHGLRDPLLPYRITQAQCAFLKAQGLRIEFKSYDKDHTMLPEEVAEIREWLLKRPPAPEAAA